LIIIFAQIQDSNQLLSNTKVVDHIFLYNFYIGRISSFYAENLVLGAQTLTLFFLPKTGATDFPLNPGFSFVSIR